MNMRTLLSCLVALVTAVAAGTAGADELRQRTRPADGWRFALGHARDPVQGRCPKSAERVSCARRPNLDHPCRLNIDQGWKPVSMEASCG
jgi:hypothetical protein